MSKYIIKNIKYNNYFQKELTHGFHWVLDMREAYIFENKNEANKAHKKMKNLRQYENLKIEKL